MASYLPLAHQLSATRQHDAEREAARARLAGRVLDARRPEPSRHRGRSALRPAGAARA